MGNVSVEAYCGYKGEETPGAFTQGGARLIVKEILTRWYTEEHSCFRVLADDGHRYVLRCNLETLEWELVIREEKGKIMEGPC